MNRMEMEHIQSAGRITELVGCILHNCDYCEDQGMNVTEVRKTVQWILTGTALDLEKINTRLNREYELWQPKD